MTALRFAETVGRYEVGWPDLAALGEPAAEPVSEAELSWIWAGQRYPEGALQLVDGRPLRVVSPGRPGGGAGPDFLDAVLEIGGERLRGDVELHVRASWFRAHGHDTDPAYDGVVLHVVFRADEGPATRLHGGGSAAVAAFAPWLEGRAQELERWLASEALWREPCRDAAWRLGEEGVRSALREAGRRRWEARVEGLRRLASEAGEREAAWWTLLDLMGVGGDRAGFRRLATAFPEGLARAVAFGAQDARDGGGEEGLARALLQVAGLSAGAGDEGDGGEGRWGVGLPPALRPGLSSTGRPANRPERRLAGVAALYARAGGDLGGFARSGVAEAGSARELVAAWQVARGGVALIGEARARELALNLALPLAALDGGLRERSLALAASLPAGTAYGKTAFLEANLRTGRRVVRSALEQQGLLAFLGEWCSQGGCGRCPLS